MNTSEGKPRYRCRFCNASFLKEKVKPDGTKVSGWNTVQAHMDLYHPDELAKISASIH